MMWLDVGIVFLLIIAIGFCYRLSDRLQSIKGLTSNLTPTIERLSQVLNSASQSIGILKQVTDAGQKGLTAYIPNAQALNTDLLLLIEHADRLSYRLDELIEKASSVEKDLRQTVLVSMRQSDKQHDPHSKSLSTGAAKTSGAPTYVQQTQVNPINDPRDLFVQRVISRYPKDDMPKLYEPILKSQEG
jgi:hypothetical protein